MRTISAILLVLGLIASDARWVSANDGHHTRNRVQRLVHIIYLVPADKALNLKYVEHLRRAVRNVRSWYEDQLDRRTFVTDKPTVSVIHLSQPGFAYNAPNQTLQFSFFNNVIHEAFALTGAVFDDPNNRWIFYIDADPACGQDTGATFGVALLPANDFRGLSGEQNIPPCPGQLPDNNPVGRWVGGLAHLMGRAFGLDFPPGCVDGDPNTACQENALMWTGYVRFPNTFLLPLDKEVLAQS